MGAIFPKSSTEERDQGIADFYDLGRAMLEVMVETVGRGR
jgi:hypothetical protein